jgi:hypothetical protein
MGIRHPPAGHQGAPFGAAGLQARDVKTPSALSDQSARRYARVNRARKRMEGVAIATWRDHCGKAGRENRSRARSLVKRPPDFLDQRRAAIFGNPGFFENV